MMTTRKSEDQDYIPDPFGEFKDDRVKGDPFKKRSLTHLAAMPDPDPSHSKLSLSEQLEQRQQHAFQHVHFDEARSATGSSERNWDPAKTPAHSFATSTRTQPTYIPPNTDAPKYHATPAATRGGVALSHYTALKAEPNVHAADIQRKTLRNSRKLLKSLEDVKSANGGSFHGESSMRKASQEIKDTIERIQDDLIRKKKSTSRSLHTLTTSHGGSSATLGASGGRNLGSRRASSLTASGRSLSLHGSLKGTTSNSTLHKLMEKQAADLTASMNNLLAAQETESLGGSNTSRPESTTLGRHSRLPPIPSSAAASRGHSAAAPPYDADDDRYPYDASETSSVSSFGATSKDVTSRLTDPANYPTSYKKKLAASQQKREQVDARAAAEESRKKAAVTKPPTSASLNALNRRYHSTPMLLQALSNNTSDAKALFQPQHALLHDADTKATQMAKEGNSDEEEDIEPGPLVKNTFMTSSGNILYDNHKDLIDKYSTPAYAAQASVMRVSTEELETVTDDEEDDDMQGMDPRRGGRGGFGQGGMGSWRAFGSENVLGRRGTLQRQASNPFDITRRLTDRSQFTGTSRYKKTTAAFKPTRNTHWDDFRA